MSAVMSTLSMISGTRRAHRKLGCSRKSGQFSDAGEERSRSQHDLNKQQRSASLDTNYSIENNPDNTGTTEDAADTTESDHTTEDISTQKKAQENISRPGKKEADEDQLTKDLLLCVRDRLKRPAPAAIPEDSFDLFGRYIAIKLRTVEKRQSLIAEKIINDTLFDAELGNLRTEPYRRT